MTEEQIINVLSKVHDDLQPQIIREVLFFNKSFRDQGYDSLDRVEYLMNVERELSIHISDDIAEDIVTPQDLLKICLEQFSFKQLPGKDSKSIII